MKNGFRGNNKKVKRVFLTVAAVVILLNVAAWCSAAFCDWYIANVFPIWVNTYGRVTGIFPFSAGEWLIAAGLALAAAALLLGVVWVVLGAVGGVRRARSRIMERKASGAEGIAGVWVYARAPQISAFRRFSRSFYIFFAWTVLTVCLIMTLNCLILYHATPISERWFGEDDGEYTPVELVEMYNLVAGECNRLAEVVERDGSGMAAYVASDGIAISRRDGANWNRGLKCMADEARELMQGLGTVYPQLAGWYPRPKAMFFSDFMCQQYMQGYYFPFSMEANYNDVMHILNIPSTMCHELAHLKGFIYEDEANFIGYLACVQSENTFFQYAGYLSVLNYLYNDICKLALENPELYEKTVAQVGLADVSDQVRRDDIFVSEEEWKRINGKALIDTEVVDKAADAFIDMNLKINGVSDGAVSYSRVVKLLLQYYRQQE
ncbi:MAG: DUF3810 domain-containing protein [Butyrivibrio sp.]|nr:DUF3810 domain-containing protein [Acetatifactor muris]MCM1559912.1 DUF3810 domain-containing protein [Butyrivibrio sp.]